MRRICVFVTVGSGLARDVLTSAENPGIGGSQYAALRLARLLAEEFPARETLLVTDQPAARFEGSPFPHLGFTHWDTWRAGENDCVVVTNSQFRNPAVVRCVEGAGRVIGWSHHPFDRTLRSHLLPRMDVVVSPGVFALASNRLLGVEGIHIPHHIPPGSGERRVPPRPPEQVNFVFMSSGLAIKGFWDVMAIWGTIREAVPQARLHVVGNTPIPLPRETASTSYSFIERDIEEGRLVLHGPVGIGKSVLFGDMHIGLVNPRGLSESFVLTAFELMASGIPIVSTSRQGMYESMRYLPEAESRTVSRISRTAIELATNPESLQLLADRAQASVAEMHQLGPEIASRWVRLADDDDLQGTRRELQPMWPLDHPARRVVAAVGGLIYYRFRLRRRWRRLARP